MSGYRCVNYYELCRLCTASSGSKTGIFSEEGKKKDIVGKIAECLPVVISEKDKLPKILCSQCILQVEQIAKFRETCINAQNMLESCLNSSKLRNGGKVYIKDVTTKKQTNPPPTTISAPSLIKVTASQTNMMNSQTIRQTSSGSSDFLSSIIEAVGIQNMDETQNELITSQQQPKIKPPQQQQPAQQYTITLDGQTIKTNSIRYKIEPSTTVTMQQDPLQTPKKISKLSQARSQVDEFLKIKTSPKMSTTVKKKGQQKVKLNTVLETKKSEIITSQQHQQLQLQNKQKSREQPQKQLPMINSNTAITSPQKTISLQELKFISTNKCFVPFTLKDSISHDQQIVRLSNDTKNLVLPTTFLQMKLQPQISVDGQHVVQLTPANLPTSLSIATTSQQHQLQSISNNMSPTQNETRCIFTTPTGQNVTITHQPLNMLTTANLQEQIQSQPLQQIQLQPQQQQLSTIDTSIGKVQLTTLQNVSATNKTHPLPQKSGITIQRVKTESSNNKMTQCLTKNLKQPPVRLNTTSALPTQTAAIKSKKTKTFKASTAKTLNKTIKVMKTDNPVGSTTMLVAGGSTTATTILGTEKSSAVPTCDVCEKVFKRKEHLAQHMKLHLGLRPFKCEEPNCNKAFSRKEHLLRHVVSHTGKKMFSCEFCQKLFSRKDNLNKHRRLRNSMNDHCKQPSPYNLQ